MKPSSTMAVLQVYSASWQELSVRDPRLTQKAPPPPDPTRPLPILELQGWLKVALLFRMEAFGSSA